MPPAARSTRGGELAVFPLLAHDQALDVGQAEHSSDLFRKVTVDLEAPSIPAGVSERMDEQTYPAAVDEVEFREVDPNAVA